MWQLMALPGWCPGAGGRALCQHGGVGVRRGMWDFWTCSVWPQKPCVSLPVWVGQGLWLLAPSQAGEDGHSWRCRWLQCSSWVSPSCCGESGADLGLHRSQTCCSCAARAWNANAASATELQRLDNDNGWGRGVLSVSSTKIGTVNPVTLLRTAGFLTTLERCCGGWG